MNPSHYFDHDMGYYDRAVNRGKRECRNWLLAGLIWIALVTVLANLSGCATRADVILVREFIYNGTATQRAESIEWAKMLGPTTQPDDGVSGHTEKLPVLTAKDVQDRVDNAAAVEAFVKQSRSHDRR
jgi:hypothetical protein